MFWFAAEQKASPEKLQAFPQWLETKVRTLRVNEAKISSENESNEDYFRIEGNHNCSQNGKVLLKVF